MIQLREKDKDSSGYIMEIIFGNDKEVNRSNDFCGYF